MLFFSLLVLSLRSGDTPVGICGSPEMIIMNGCNAHDEQQEPCEADPNCAWNTDLCFTLGEIDYYCMPKIGCLMPMGPAAITFYADGSCADLPVMQAPPPGTQPMPTNNEPMPAPADVAVDAQTAGAEILGAAWGIDTCAMVTQAEADDYYWLQDHDCVTIGDENNFVTNAFVYNPSVHSLASTCNNADMTMHGDAMGVVFNFPVSAVSRTTQDFVDKSLFQVTLTNGDVYPITCATMQPAVEASELHTVLMFGEFGDGLAGTVYPAKIEVVGDFFLDAPGGVLVNAKGLSLEGYPGMTYATYGPAMVMAHFAESKIDGDDLLNGCAANYPDSKYEVKIVMDGGATLDGVTSLSALRNSPTFKKFFILIGDDGTEMTDGYIGVGDLDDRDNYFDLCLSEDFDVGKLKYVEMTCTENPQTALYLPNGKAACSQHRVEVAFPTSEVKSSKESSTETKVGATQLLNQITSMQRDPGFLTKTFSVIGVISIPLWINVIMQKWHAHQKYTEMYSDVEN